MATLSAMMESVKGRLGSPRAQHPSNYQLLLNLTTSIQRYINRLALSQRPWAVDEVGLVVSAGVEDYPIIATNFGRAIQVRTTWPSNLSHVERDIDFFELGDVNFDWPYPKNMGAMSFAPDGSPNTAMRMAFFRKSGLDQAYVRVQPIPQITAQYQILYQVGNFADTAALATIPVLPQHHSLIEVRTAIDMLPVTEWFEDEGANSKKRVEFGAQLDRLERALASDFESYIRSISAKRRPSYRNVLSID